MMKKMITRGVTVVGFAAAVWVVWPAFLYFGFIALFWSQRSYAVFPGAATGAAALCGLALIRPSRLLDAVAIPSALGLCACAVAGRLHDFTAYGEPAPGPWEWINSMSLLGTITLLVMVGAKFMCNRQMEPNNGVDRYVSPAEDGG